MGLVVELEAVSAGGAIQVNSQGGNTENRSVNAGQAVLELAILSLNDDATGNTMIYMMNL